MVEILTWLIISISDSGLNVFFRKVLSVPDCHLQVSKWQMGMWRGDPRGHPAFAEVEMTPGAPGVTSGPSGRSILRILVLCSEVKHKPVTCSLRRFRSRWSSPLIFKTTSHVVPEQTICAVALHHDHPCLARVVPGRPPSSGLSYLPSSPWGLWALLSPIHAPQNKGISVHFFFRNALCLILPFSQILCLLNAAISSFFSVPCLTHVAINTTV